MRIVVLAGGVGGAKYTRGLREECIRRWPDGEGGTTAEIDVIVNTADDLWLAGLRLMPDFDSLLYALAGVNDEIRGWGRAGETERVSDELAAWGAGWPWFTLGDLDLGTHVARTSWLRDGMTPTQVAERLQQRWTLGARLHPVTDHEIDTQVLVDDPEAPAGAREMHFQEWWTRHRATMRARSFRQLDIEVARPAPGVLDTLAAADLIMLAPSNPVVSIGPILGVPGVRDAVTAAPAPVVGVSPIIAGSVVRGMADACLTAIGVATDAAAVARHYGAASHGGLLDAWLVDETDASSTSSLVSAGIRTAAVPLWMHDVDTSATLAGDAIDLALR